MLNSDNHVLGQNASRQILDLFVLPEVERRQDAGVLPRPLALEAAQVIFFPDGREPEVRVNTEVRISIGIAFKPGVEKRPGECILAEEIEGIAECKLRDGDYPDCGHATLFNIDGRWTLAFDFITNKDTARKTLDVAGEFVQAARYSFAENNMCAFVDSLYSGVELTAKSLLLTKIGDTSLRQKTNHRAIHQRCNRHTRYGLIAASYAELLNRLSNLRGGARYLDKPFTLTHDDGVKMLRVAEKMLMEAQDLAESAQSRQSQTAQRK